MRAGNIDVGQIRNLQDTLQQQTYTYGSDVGAANDYQVTLPTVGGSAPTLQAGSVVTVLAANTNTGASTLTVNGGTAISITRDGTTALSAGDIIAGQIFTVVYDGTTFQLAGTAGTPAAPLTPVVIGFNVLNGSAGTALAYALAPRTSEVNKCKVVVKSSDPSADLVFDIKKNGTSVFTSGQTVTHGASAGSVVTITALTSVPLTVTADDVFTIDVSSGSSSWSVVVQLET